LLRCYLITWLSFGGILRNKFSKLRRIIQDICMFNPANKYIAKGQQQGKKQKKKLNKEGN
jgi:hypothetical protein